MSDDESDRSNSELGLETARIRVLDALVSFVRGLRRRSIDVPADGSIVAAQVLSEVGFDSEERARTALRSALISHHADYDAFDAAFSSFWRALVESSDSIHEHAPEQGRRTPIPPSDPRDGVFSELSADVADSDGPGNELDDSRPDRAESDDHLSGAAEVRAGDPEIDPFEAGDSVTASVYSQTGRPERVVAPSIRLREDTLTRAVADLTGALSRLRGRRRSRSGDEFVDLRRAIRRSVTAGGAVESLPRQSRKRTAVKAVLLVDVSRSVLDAIDRPFLLSFLGLVHHEWRHVRIFFFDTEIREITDAFDAESLAGMGRQESDLAVTGWVNDDRSPGEALERAEAEWGGGTRIGHAIETLRRDESTAIDRDTAVFVVSDGLEVGEIDRLERGMAWLGRRAAAVLWLNPLAASSEYEPICRGMAASLPYIDGLFAFTGPDDVEEIARQLDRGGLDGSIGYQYDPRRYSN